MLKFFLAPLLGCIIGYITNDIAIKMLFHPREAVYIGKFHIPFTPGLIPQQKERIAVAIGSMVSRELVNEETLKETLLSEQTKMKIKEAVIKWCSQFESSEKSIGFMLNETFSEEQVEKYRARLVAEGSVFLSKKLENAGAGEIIAEAVVKEIETRLSSQKLVRMVLEPVRSTIAEAVEQKIRDQGQEYCAQMLDRVGDDIMEVRFCDIYERLDRHIPRIAEEIADAYGVILEQNLGRVLQAVNIEQVVVDKIRGLDAKQLEEMVFGVMKRDLNAIVYLGAMLGFFMGFINLLF